MNQNFKIGLSELLILFGVDDLIRLLRQNHKTIELSVKGHNRKYCINNISKHDSGSIAFFVYEKKRNPWDTSTFMSSNYSIYLEVIPINFFSIIIERMSSRIGIYKNLLGKAKDSGKFSIKLNEDSQEVKARKIVEQIFSKNKKEAIEFLKKEFLKETT